MDVNICVVLQEINSAARKFFLDQPQFTVDGSAIKEEPKIPTKPPSIVTALFESYEMHRNLLASTCLEQTFMAKRSNSTQMDVNGSS